MYPILNKPLIQWTFKQARYSTTIDHTFVSTDDKEIIELADTFEIESILRPKHLCTDSASSESALSHAIEYIQSNHNISPDIIVFLQATSPLRLHNDIDNAIDIFINTKADSLFSATKLDDLTLWKNKNENWQSLNFDYKNRLRRQDMLSNYIENGSIYIFKPQILKKTNNRLGGKISMYEMNFWQTWEIDTINEVDLIEFYMKKYKLN